MTKYILEVSSDMGHHEIELQNYLAHTLENARVQARDICTTGFWLENKRFPANRVNYVEVVEIAVH